MTSARMTPMAKLEDAIVTVVEGVEEEAEVAGGVAAVEERLVPRTANRECYRLIMSNPTAGR